MPEEVLFKNTHNPCPSRSGSYRSHMQPPSFEGNYFNRSELFGRENFSSNMVGRVIAQDHGCNSFPKDDRARRLYEQLKSYGCRRSDQAQGGGTFGNDLFALFRKRITTLHGRADATVLVVEIRGSTCKDRELVVQ